MLNIKAVLITILLATNALFAFDSDEATEMLYLSRFTDKRKPVVVVDTGINFKDPRIAPYLCVNGHQDYTGEGLYDYMGHGTNVSWQIIKRFNKKKYCVLMVKYFPTNGFISMGNLERELAGIRYAVRIRAKLINFSGGGESYNRKEDFAITEALRHNIKVVVSSGNSGLNLNSMCAFYPACLRPNKNLHVVGSLSKKGKRMSHSNYGRAVTNWALGEDVEDQNGNPLTGTSQAAAVFSGFLLRK